MLQVRGIAICGSVFAVVLLCGTLAYGQNTAGTILGAVSDESGARLPGVTVTITHLDPGIVRSATTDEGGRYRAPALGLGNYDVKAELTGFRTALRSEIQLTVAAEVVVNLSLSVGTVTEQVQVPPCPASSAGNITSTPWTISSLHELPRLIQTSRGPITFGAGVKACSDFISRM